MTSNPIAQQLDDSRREVRVLQAQFEQLQRSLDVAQARLEAYEVAAKAFDDAAPKQPVSKRGPKTRNRLPNEDWQTVFRVLCCEMPNGFGYDDIFRTAALLDIDVKRPSLRTKMMNYVNDGYAQRVDDGKFIITRKGLGYFKVQEPALQAIETGGKQNASKENEPISVPAVGSDAGEARGGSPFTKPWINHHSGGTR